MRHRTRIDTRTRSVKSEAVYFRIITGVIGYYKRIFHLCINPNAIKPNL